MKIHTKSGNILLTLLTLTNVAAVVGLVCNMYPGSQQGGQDINNNQPPQWGPEMESRYPFTKYSRDALLWIMATSIPHERHCASLILRLTGAAKDLAEEQGPEFIANGGLIPKFDAQGNVVMEQANAVTYLMHHLQARIRTAR